MKWNIQKRLLVLVMAAGILSFLAMSGLSFYGLSIVRNEMRDMGSDVSLEKNFGGIGKGARGIH